MAIYELVSALLLINLLLYIIFTFYYDIRLMKNRIPTNDSTSPPAWSSKLEMIFVTLPSFLVWILFIITPGILTFQPNIIINFSLFSVFSQVENLLMGIGIIITSIGTFIAFLGRKARGNYAISWGIPNKVIKEGIFKYIRHPLYCSYLLYFLGFLLIFPSIFTIFMQTGFYGYNKSAIYEESVLLKYFGEEYESYQNNTSKFFIKIW